MLEAEIFGLDDIEGVIGTFIADCVNNAACEITVHGLLVPDPVPSQGLLVAQTFVTSSFKVVVHKIDEKDCAASDTITAHPAANDFPAVDSAVSPAMCTVNPAVSPAISTNVSEQGACMQNAQPAREPDSGSNVPSTFRWDPGLLTGKTVKAAVSVKAAINVHSGSTDSGMGSSVVLQNSLQLLPGLICVNVFAQVPNIDVAMPAGHAVTLNVSE